MPILQGLRQKVAAAIIGKSLGGGGGSFGTPLFNAPGYTQRDWLAFYQGYPYAATQVITQRLARIELVVNENTPDASGDNVVEMDQHPFFDLIDNPLDDKSMTRFEFLEQVAVYFLLCGEVYGYTPRGTKTGEPKQVILLRPDLVTPAVDRGTGLITGYIYNPGKQIPFELDEMWTMKRFNPKNPYRGYGLVEAALPYIQTENYASRFASNFFFNSAKPAGVVSVTGTMDKDEFMQLREQWKQDFKGVQNAGKVGFVRNAEVEFTQIGPSTEQSGVVDIKEISKGDILNIWRVSKTSLGEVADTNRASAETAQYTLDTNNIDPEMYRLTDGLRSLFDRFVPDGVNQWLDYKSPIRGDTSEKIETWRAMFAMGALTPNDIRDEEGMEDLEAGGDQAYLPVNLGAIGGVAEQPEPATKRYRFVKKASDAKKKLKTPSLSLTAAQKEQYRATFHKNLVPYQDKFKAAFGKLMDAQRDAVIANIKRGGKALSRKQDNSPFDVAEASAAFTAAVMPVVQAAAVAQGQFAGQFVGYSGYKATPQLTQFIQNRLDMLSYDFSTETSNAIVSAISEGVAGGASVDELGNTIERLYEDINGWQADRIARTELAAASFEAQLESWQESSVITGIQWQADPEACEYCKELDGSIVSIDQPAFAALGDTLIGADGGQMNVDYTDVEPGYAHPHCECAGVPFTDEVTPAMGPTVLSGSGAEE